MYNIYNMKHEEACMLVEELNNIGIHSSIIQNIVSIIPINDYQLNYMFIYCDNYNVEAYEVL